LEGKLVGPQTPGKGGQFSHLGRKMPRTRKKRLYPRERAKPLKIADGILPFTAKDMGC